MWTSNTMTLAEALATSGMGFLIVFAVLGSLAIIIVVFSKVFSSINGKKSAAQPAAPAAAVVEKDDSDIVAIVTSVICEDLCADPSELSISGIREL